MKRLLLFLALLGIGIAALLVAIGDEDAVKTGPRPTDPEPTRPPPTGIEVNQGRVGATVAQTGYLKIPHYRTIPLPDGRERKEEAYILEAKDSQPIEAGRQRLEGVEVQLFENGKHAANLLARQAFVELGRDANGTPELQRDKDVDLRDAVFVTLDDSKMPGLRLDLGDARVKVGDNELRIETAADQPVQLVVGGARDGETDRNADGRKHGGKSSGTLRGKGLLAIMPRDPRDQGGAMQSADIKILHEPVLETHGAVVHALGSMHYVEDVRSGTARITLADGVQLDLQRGVSMSGLGIARAAAADGNGVLSTIRGDNFTGWLLRGKQIVEGREHNELIWRRLQVTGAPASVDVAGGRLTTPKITVQPGLFGEAFLVTAHGGESRVETTTRTGSKQKERFTGVSPDRIHLVRPADLVGPLHRSFGFPEWTLGPLNDLRVVAFDGGSRLESASRMLEASKGVQAFGSEGSDHAIARGFGEVRIEQRATKQGEADLVGEGTDGFWLRTTADSELLRLGAVPDFADPNAPWRAQRYDLRQGGMSLHGQGAARIERQNERPGDRSNQRTRLSLRAPAAEISGRLTKDGIDLMGVRRLEATIENQEVQTLDVAGLPVRTTIVRGPETVHAEAPRLLQIGPQSLSLIGASGPDASSLWGDLPDRYALPSLDIVVAPPHAPSKRLTLTGPQIDVHHLGSSAVFVDATANDNVRPTVNAKFENKTGAPTTASFDAARLRVLPFAMTKEAQQMHTGATSSVLADLSFHALGKPWIIVDDVRNFRLQDEQQGLIEGQGTRLLLSEGAEAGVFIGDPELGTPAEVRQTDHGRTITTRGARVRVFREEVLRLQALRTFDGRPTVLLPTVTLHEPGKKGPLSHLRAVCRGDIEVLPDSVVCRGPVEAQGLCEDGSEDPEGMHFDAEHFVMERQGKKGERGEISRALWNDVKVVWSGMTATTSALELDLRFSRLIARDPKGAVIALPNGRTLTAPRIEVNYETWSFDLQDGSFAQKNPTQGPGR